LDGKPEASKPLLAWECLVCITSKEYSWKRWLLRPSWEIQLSHQVLAWLEAEPVSIRERVDVVLSVLAAHGPNLGRPLVDSVSGSGIRNLKELRVLSSRDHAIRILFCFTPARIALLLVAGDKSNNWNSWYKQAIQEAEEIYERYVEN
jgi:hypothetical protein